MKVMAFIRAVAFISSVVARIVALPFFVVIKVIRFFWIGMRKAAAFCILQCYKIQNVIKVLNTKRKERHNKKDRIKKDRKIKKPNEKLLPMEADSCVLRLLKRIY